MQIGSFNNFNFYNLNIKLFIYIDNALSIFMMMPSIIIIV